MSFDCEVAAEETPEKIILNIEGDSSGLLIGKRGQNLDAIQYILSKAINRADNERKMIMVDSEAYRKRREESLLNLAEKIREKVKKTKKPVSLSHMNAHDRRIIHLALQEDEGLITKSRGEGEYRKILILPARRNSANNAKARVQE
jgi:spoIIIJ-associated protein